MKSWNVSSPGASLGWTPARVASTEEDLSSKTRFVMLSIPRQDVRRAIDCKGCSEGRARHHGMCHQASLMEGRTMFRAAFC